MSDKGEGSVTVELPVPPPPTKVNTPNEVLLSLSTAVRRGKENCINVTGMGCVVVDSP